MHYEYKNLEFSFDLPEGWRHDAGNIAALTFYGPKGGVGRMSELIQIKIATILPQYVAPESREKFLAEPKAEISRCKVGDEENVVVVRKDRDSEISIVRDGLHYSIMHFHDDVSLKAVECLKQTVRFPSAEKAKLEIRRRADPKSRAIDQAMKADSPEAARDILSEAGIHGKRVPGGTYHDVAGSERKDGPRIGKDCLSAFAVLVVLIGTLVGVILH